MEKKYFQIHGIPSILWGNPSNKLYIYIHGQCGYKEEAEIFANIAVNHGWQVLSIDLPKHGERKEENISFDPWNVIPELLAIMKYAKSNWNQIALYANSIGAWFSMLSFGNENLEECVFVSPILDMQQLISNMMLWANVSEEQLKHELIIPTSFGHTLSWEYLQYVKKHPITKWNTTTRILYGKHDELTELSVVEKFTRHFNCNLTIIENGEHWFNTPEQLKVLNKWTNTLFE
ncbi:alpha/beta hydrolase [Clostridioides sp. ES-S-0145-01]|uniref:alpha/beta hydrolase n=1 Tax=Clostridioides sp. ES-S-0145-01 TaxID=2770784 RepID=UPI001D10321A|nr:alpha/beta hydrolase [Clostridioides sp. ES-S-0145-01]